MKTTSECTPLQKTDKKFKEIERLFEGSWKNNGRRAPSIRDIYEVSTPTVFEEDFELQCGVGETQEMFHGTELTCGLQGSLCTDPNCSTCCIMQQGFDLAKAGSWSGKPVEAVCFTSHSSVAKGYGLNRKGGYVWHRDNWADAKAGNSILLVKIACGRMEKVTEKVTGKGKDHFDQNTYDTRLISKDDGSEELMIFNKKNALVRNVIVF